MDHKKLKVEATTATRDVAKLHKPTGNVYESVVIIAKRSNQIAVDMKEELDKKLLDFASPSDNLEEVFENREQIEIAKHYENLPKPTLIATQEFLNGQVYFENPTKKGNPTSF